MGRGGPAAAPLLLLEGERQGGRTRLLKIAAGHPDRLVLDLSGLTFVDVAGARALDDVYTLLQTVCPVILRQPRPSARAIFGLTGLMEH